MDLFGHSELPEWLQKRALMNEQENESNLGWVASTIGSLVTAGAVSASPKVSSTFLRNFSDAYQSISDPYYTLKRRQGELQLEQTQMGIESEKVNLEIQHENLKNVSHDHATLAEWQKAHPTWQSRLYADTPEVWSDAGRKQVDSIVLNDSRQPQKAAFVDSLKETGQTLNKLRQIDPVGAAQFSNIQQWTPEQYQKLQDAVASAQGKIDTENEKTQQEMADYEAKGFTITRQWTDTRGRIRYSKTAPPKTAPVKTEKVSPGEDVYERDPDTGEYHKVVSGPPKTKDVNFNTLLTEKDRIQAAMDSMPKKKGKPVDPEMYSAFTNRLGHINSEIKGTPAPETPSPSSLAGRIKDMTNPMTSERYPGDWMTKRARDQEKAVTENVEGSFKQWYYDVDALESLYAKQKGAQATGASAIERLDKIPGRPMSQMPAPKKGTIDSGYRFKGGDPADPDNWEPVQ